MEVALRSALLGFSLASAGCSADDEAPSLDEAASIDDLPSLDSPLPGLPHSESREIDDSDSEVETVTYQRYLELKNVNRVEAEEQLGEFVYFSINESRHVPLGDADASVDVALRYRTKLPFETTTDRTEGAGAVPAARGEQSTSHGYANSVNRLHERRIGVTDDRGNPADRNPGDGPPGDDTFADVNLEIVWTLPSQYGWNYCIPELHAEPDRWLSTPSFLEGTLGATSVLLVSIPDTQYSFYIIDGHVSPYFFDSEKFVIWRLNSADLERKIREMSSISVSSKAIRLSAPGGDMCAYLSVDFSDREDSPAVRYYVRFDGP